MICKYCKKEFDPDEEARAYNRDSSIRKYGLTGSYDPFFQLCANCAIDENVAGYGTYSGYSEFIADDD